MKYVCNECGYSRKSKFSKCSICDSEDIITIENEKEEISLKKDILENDLKKVKNMDAEERRKRLEDIIKEDEASLADAYDLYLQSIKIANNFTFIGMFSLVLAVIIAIVLLIFTFLQEGRYLILAIITFVSGFVTKITFDWMGLVLQNLAELNKKRK